jgi:hypothetical protein
VTPKASKQLQHAAHAVSNVVYGAERALNTKPRKAGAVRYCKTCGEPLPKGAFWRPALLRRAVPRRDADTRAILDRALQL